MSYGRRLSALRSCTENLSRSKTIDPLHSTQLTLRSAASSDLCNLFGETPLSFVSGDNKARMLCNRRRDLVVIQSLPFATVFPRGDMLNMPRNLLCRDYLFLSQDTDAVTAFNVQEVFLVHDVPFPGCVFLEDLPMPEGFPVILQNLGS